MIHEIEKLVAMESTRTPRPMPGAGRMMAGKAELLGMVPSIIQVTQHGDVHVVGFPEPTLLDTLAAERFGREVNALIDQGLKRGLVIDFQRVRFLSSPTLGVLVSLSRRARKNGANVVLACVPREFAAVFKVTDLLKFFEVFETREAAVERLTTIEPGKPEAQPQ